MYEGLDTVILYEELAYQDTVPVRWLPGLPSEYDLQRIAESNLRLLQACLALQEQARVDKAEETSAYAADIQRLDMKMNLLLDLMGRLLRANSVRPPERQLRFNALGAVLNDGEGQYTNGADGILEIYLNACLPEPLRLIGKIVAMDLGVVRIKFSPVGEMNSDLIEKLAFRRHRRIVAGAKQPKKGTGKNESR
jgi:hypothetical protein